MNLTVQIDAGGVIAGLVLILVVGSVLAVVLAVLMGSGRGPSGGAPPR